MYCDSLNTWANAATIFKNLCKTTALNVNMNKCAATEVQVYCAHMQEVQRDFDMSKWDLSTDSQDQEVGHNKNVPQFLICFLGSCKVSWFVDLHHHLCQKKGNHSSYNQAHFHLRDVFRNPGTFGMYQHTSCPVKAYMKKLTSFLEPLSKAWTEHVRKRAPCFQKPATFSTTTIT